MKINKLLIVFIFILTIFPASAQLIPFSLEVRGGANYTNTDIKGLDNDQKISYRAEVVFDYNVIPFLFLRTGATFGEKNTKYNFYGMGDNNGDRLIDIANYNEKVKARYIQMPFMIGTKISLPALFKVNAAIGGYAAYGLGGKYKGTNYFSTTNINIGSVPLENIVPNDFGQTQMNSFDYKTFNSIYKKYDGGLIISVGIEYHRITLNGGYEYGLVNFAKGYGTAKNRNAFVTLGVRIL